MKKPTKASIAKVKKELDKTGKSSININYKIWTPKYQVQHFENQICVWDEESEIHILKRKSEDGIQMTMIRKENKSNKVHPTCICKRENGQVHTIIAIKNSSIDKLQYALEEYKRWETIKNSDVKAEIVKNPVKKVVKPKPKK